MYNFNEKVILILGAGQIGLATAHKIAEYNPISIILHTLTEEEAELAKDTFSNISSETSIIKSSGDIFGVYGSSNINLDLNYLYNSKMKDKYKLSAIYQLCNKYKPDIIIDAVNTATILGKSIKEYSYVFETNDPAKVQDINNNIMRDNPIMILINFINSLKIAMNHNKVDKYIKVSTTGLGGMGFDMPYTHGEQNNDCLSDELMGKISTSGIIHQFLWTLSHTLGYNISVIVPATCVGWGRISNDIISNDLGQVLLLDYEQKLNSDVQFPLTPSKSINLNNKLRGPIVYAGENNAYTLSEIELLTSLGQMESISKEEVANAVIEDINGNSKHNILRSMDLSILGPTYFGRRNRDIIINKLKRSHIDNEGTITTGNLGPKVTKHIYELYLILSSCNSSIQKLKNLKKVDVVESVSQMIVMNKKIRTEILSMGLSIMAEKYYYYNRNTINSTLIINNEELEINIEKNWVDLRKNNIFNLIDKVINAFDESTKIKKGDLYNINMDKDLEAISDVTEVGELLAYIYSMERGVYNGET